MREKPLARLTEVMPAEVMNADHAAYELALDDRSKLAFISLKSGAVAVQLWRPGQARDGHGYLLAGNALLSASEVAHLLTRLTPKGASYQC